MARSARRIGGLATVLLLTVVTSAAAASYPVTLGSYGPGCVGSSYFATGMSGQLNCSIANGGAGWTVIPDTGSVGAGATGQWQVNAPSGLTITSASVPFIEDFGLSSGHGWNAGSFWNGGSDVWSPTSTTASTGISPISSSYYGFKLYCYSSSCPGITRDLRDASVTVPEIDLTVDEDQGPALIAVGSNNLWYQRGWVWNPAGDPWSIEVEASDASGVCDMSAQAENLSPSGPTASPNTANGFQQCPSPVEWYPSDGAEVDTDQIVRAGSSGSFPLQLDATNAAGVQSNPSETIKVDSVQPSVSLSTPNDSNPSVWVNHAVTVDAAASAGPSGVGGVNCSVDGAAAHSYPAGGVTVNGDGTHSVSCTAWNRAVGPQGQPNTGTSSMSIKIDEAPPTVAFEPQNPADPTQLVVDTRDSESGVGGGSIEIAPVGTSSWTALPTSFDGQHLLATLDDAGLSGPYTIEATSCDNVGNCASTTESLTLPLRLRAASAVSFTNIDTPAKVVRERVLVDYHFKRVRRRGKLVKVKTGGHYHTVRLVIDANARCAHTRVRTGRRRWRQINVCRTLKLRIVRSKTVAFGKPVTVHGLLLTSPGVPVANAPVSILTAPDNGLDEFSQAATVTTSSGGVWTVKLPAGPSRIIHAVYGGSATMLPSTGLATVNVPAKISVSIAPRIVPWNGAITIRGHLVGGYVPPDGVALRVLVLYPGNVRPTPLLALRTNAKGGFVIDWSFGSGRGVATYPFSVATTASESDYPFAASEGRRISITFGRPTPAVAVQRRHKAPRHKRRAAHKRHLAKHRPKR